MRIEYRPPRLVGLRHVREHVLWLRYSDGVEGEVDLGAGLAGPMLESLRDVSIFAAAQIEPVRRHADLPFTNELRSALRIPVS